MLRNGDIAGKECALITCCEEDDMSVMDGVRIPMERMCALNKWKMVGEVLIPRVLNVGDIDKTDGSTNLAAVSWWTYLFFNPNMIAYAMAKTSYSGEMVRNTQKVILTIPSVGIADAVMGCGSTTGYNTDKVEKFNIELEEVEGSDIKIPVHSRVAIQCTLKEFHEVGDHYLYICDVEQVYGNEEEQALFAWNGYSQLGPVH